MKILIIGEVFYPEEFLINDLALEWIKKGFHVDVLTRVPSYPQDKIFSGFKNKLFQKNDYMGITVFRFPVILGYQRSKVVKVINYLNFIVCGSIIALAIGKNYDHVFIYQTGPLTIALPGVLIKKLFNKKTTIWIQDVWPDTVYAYGFKKTKFLEKFLDYLVKFIYKNTDNILVSCEGFIPKITKYVQQKKIEWIPNWSLVKNSPLKNNFKLPGKFNFTFSGNIGKVQNLENVILGFSKISNTYTDVYLNIIGDGSYLAILKKIITDSQIKNVIFYGRQPLEMMPSYFNASDVLIISLIDEEIFKITVPSKFQSYLSANKPIMGVINGEVKDLILKYKIGRVAEPSSIASIVKIFEDFIKEVRDSTDIAEKVKGLNYGLFNREKNIEKITASLQKHLPRQ